MNRSATMLWTLVFLFSCTTVPITGRRQFAPIPSSQMNALGDDSYRQVIKESKLSNDADKTAMVQRVGTRVAGAVEKYLKDHGMAERVAGYKWEFNLIESEEKNAWCMPGGKIAVYTGILPVTQNEAGLAVVLGHEIAHAIAGHSNERLSQGLATQLGGIALMTALKEKPQQTQQLALVAFGLGAQLGVLLPYSRLHERESDEMGLIFMAMAGYDPRESPKLWQRMNAESKGARPPTWLSTHPAPTERIRNAERNMGKAMQYYEASDKAKG